MSRRTSGVMPLLHIPPIYPVTVRNAFIPSLHDYISDSVIEQFSDDPDYAPSSKCAALLEQAQAALESDAPEIWTPVLTSRIAVPDETIASFLEEEAEDAG